MTFSIVNEERANHLDEADFEYQCYGVMASSIRTTQLLRRTPKHAETKGRKIDELFISMMLMKESDSERLEVTP